MTQSELVGATLPERGKLFQTERKRPYREPDQVLIHKLRDLTEEYGTIAVALHGLHIANDVFGGAKHAIWKFLKGHPEQVQWDIFDTILDLLRKRS